MSDPPPVNSLSTFGIPPLPPLKDDVIFEQDLDQISVQLYYSRGFKVNTSGYLKSGWAWLNQFHPQSPPPHSAPPPPLSPTL